MRTVDIPEGTLVLVKNNDGVFVECVVEKNNHGLLIINKPDGGKMSAAGGDLNLRWRILYDKSFPGVGHIKKGSCLRLGKKAGKIFIPSFTTLFADGFVVREGRYSVIGKNLNKNIYRELKISEHKRSWILVNKK